MTWFHEQKQWPKAGGADCEKLNFFFLPDVCYTPQPSQVLPLVLQTYHEPHQPFRTYLFVHTQVMLPQMDALPPFESSDILP